METKTEPQVEQVVEKSGEQETTTDTTVEKTTKGGKNNNKGRKNNYKGKNNNQNGGRGRGRRGGRRDNRREFSQDPEVTLETELPKKPTEVLEKPDNKEKYKLLDEIDDKLNLLRKEKKAFFQNLSKNNKDIREIKDVSTLIEICKQKNKEKEAIFKKFKVANNKKNEFNKSMDKIQASIEKYKKKLVDGQSNVEQIQNQIQSRKDKLMNDLLTIAQEKQLHKDVDKYERSLKFAAPYQEGYAKLKQLKTDRKVYAQQTKELYNEGKQLKTEIQEINDSITQKRQEAKDAQETAEPGIKLQKNEFKTRYDVLIQEEKDIINMWDKKYDDYYKQQQLIKRIDRMTKRKQKLQKEEQQRLYQEKLEKEEQEQLEALKADFYARDIAEVEDLVKYCKLLLPQEEQVEEAATEEVVSTLESQQQFKNENVEVYVKPKVADDFWSQMGGNKKKGKRGRKRQRKVVEEVQPLFDDKFRHSMDMLARFQTLKVKAPQNEGQVADSVAQLEAKVTALKELPAPSDEVLRKKLYGSYEDEEYQEDGDNNRRGGRGGRGDRRDRRRNRDDSGEGDDRRDQNQRKQKKQKKQSRRKLDVQNAEMFPSL